MRGSFLASPFAVARASWDRFMNSLLLAECRRKGMSIGTACRVAGRPRIYITAGAKVECGDGVLLNSLPCGYHAGMSYPVTILADRPCACIQIGAESRCHGCCIHAWLGITIGKRCLFAAGSQVLDAHGHSAALEHSRFRHKLQDVPAPVSIGDSCWLCLGSLVLKGAQIGEGCIIAPYSVVRAGVYPAHSLLAGSPARVVRTIPEDAVLAADYPHPLLKPPSSRLSFSFLASRPSAPPKKNRQCHRWGQR